LAEGKKTHAPKFFSDSLRGYDLMQKILLR